MEPEFGAVTCCAGYELILAGGRICDFVNATIHVLDLVMNSFWSFEGLLSLYAAENEPSLNVIGIDLALLEFEDGNSISKSVFRPRSSTVA